MVKRNKTIDAEIIPAGGSPAGIERVRVELQAWRTRALAAELQLREIQGLESAGNIAETQREQVIRAYLAEIEQLNRQTPGGLRSNPMAEEGEDQDLVNEAWWQFCNRRRGGAARF